MRKRREPIPDWAFACAGPECQNETWTYCPVCYEMFCYSHGQQHDATAEHGPRRPLPMGWAGGSVEEKIARQRMAIRQQA